MNRRGFIAALAGGAACIAAPKPSPLAALDKETWDLMYNCAVGTGYYQIFTATEDPNIFKVTEYLHKSKAPFLVLPQGFSIVR